MSRTPLNQPFEHAGEALRLLEFQFVSTFVSGDVTTESRYLSAQLRALSQPRHYLKSSLRLGAFLCDPLRLDFVINRRERQGLRRGRRETETIFQSRSIVLTTFTAVMPRPLVEAKDR